MDDSNCGEDHSASLQVMQGFARARPPIPLQTSIMPPTVSTAIWLVFAVGTGLMLSFLIPYMKDFERAHHHQDKARMTNNLFAICMILLAYLVFAFFLSVWQLATK